MTAKEMFQVLGLRKGNDDGEADKKVIKITEWKPNKDVDGDIPYDTIGFENKSELEDNGIKVEKPDGTFLPNFAIKVKDVTNSVNQAKKDKIPILLEDEDFDADIAILLSLM